VKIPTSFKLLGHKYTVAYDPGLLDREGCSGLAVYQTHQILLAPPNANRCIERVCQTFWHEVAHHMMERMGCDDLRADEKFIDMLSSLLHQVIVTAEGEL